MKKVFAIVILYNEYFHDSKTIYSLKNQNLEIIVHDNSTNIEYFEKNKNECPYKYYGSTKNIGLSKAYNNIIKKLKNCYVLTCDSDTTFPDDYIEKFYSSVENNILVYLPTIYSSKNHSELICPSMHMNKYRIIFQRKKSEEVGKIDFFSSINSGTIYDVSLFEKVKFNENLFIDHIDEDFFDALYKKKIKSKIFNASLIQNFSAIEMGDEYLLNGRITWTLKDYYVYYGKIWFLLAFLWYFRSSVFNKDARYIKKFYELYISERGKK